MPQRQEMLGLGDMLPHRGIRCCCLGLVGRGGKELWGPAPWGLLLEEVIRLARWGSVPRQLSYLTIGHTERFWGTFRGPSPSFLLVMPGGQFGWVLCSPRATHKGHESEPPRAPPVLGIL